jgi:hypothetical protein
MVILNLKTVKSGQFEAKTIKTGILSLTFQSMPFHWFVKIKI